MIVHELLKVDRIEEELKFIKRLLIIEFMIKFSFSLRFTFTVTWEDLDSGYRCTFVEIKFFRLNFKKHIILFASTAKYLK